MAGQGVGMQGRAGEENEGRRRKDNGGGTWKEGEARGDKNWKNEVKTEEIK